MTTLRDCDKKIFPICNVTSTIQLFQSQLEKNSEPNLTLLSIVIGAIENSMTYGNSSVTKTVDSRQSPSFPSLEWTDIETLYVKFQTQIKGSVSFSASKPPGFATREVVKKVSDVIWSSLTRSCYKDRAHLQSLYSYLTGNKLDCFGIAFAVVAACQLLGYKDVHLALSEDHAWVVFGENSEETAEVTWHGKTHEDKRGQSITLGVEEKSWLYLNGHPVKCTRHMEVAAMVSSMNPSVSSTMDNVEVACLQQSLMWLLFDLGHLERYPMALANLGDLEEISPTPSRLSCKTLFYKAIESAKLYYNNQHVYPYTYLGGYFYRNGKYKNALEAWSYAAGVIKKFNYNREDEEIYKEFLEIANELIPNVIKICLSTEIASSTNKLLQDPECFGYLLRFYDSICKWEEGSSTPVLHIGWAKPLVNTISKFDAKVRSHVTILLESAQSEKVGDGNNNHQVELRSEVTDNNNDIVVDKIPNDVLVKPIDTFCDKDVNNKRTPELIEVSEYVEKSIDRSLIHELASDSKCKSELFNSDPEDLYFSETYRCSLDFIKCLENQINPNEEPHPNIATLAAACSDNILNPEYLLSSGESFLSPVLSSSSSCSASSLIENKAPLEYCELLNYQPIGSSFPGLNVGNTVLKADISSSPTLEKVREEDRVVNTSNVVEDDVKLNENEALFATAPKILLQSEKMKGLKDLLLAKKLNVSAIQLQLTAQSQVLVVKRTKSSSTTDFDFIGINCSSTRTNKRSRR